MYYRRRVLLSILARNNGTMDKIRLHKLLFLFTRQQQKPSYDFLPYMYGCYSFQADQDAKTLANYYGVMKVGADTYSLSKTHKGRDFGLNDEDRSNLEELFKQYGRLRSEELIYRVYEQYPWYAVNSRLLDRPHLKPLSGIVEKARRDADVGDRRALYTLGYQGMSIERYITLLMRNGVSVLVDVRRNPVSMKYGFSKGQLQHISGECDIEYIHIPELGIAGAERKDLVSHADYKRLFMRYRGELAGKEEHLRALQSILDKCPRVAVTCFEKQYTWCHRGVLSATMRKRHGVTVKHLEE